MIDAQRMVRFRVLAALVALVALVACGREATPLVADAADPVSIDAIAIDAPAIDAIALDAPTSVDIALPIPAVPPCSHAIAAVGSSVAPGHRFQLLDDHGRTLANITADRTRHPAAIDLGAPLTLRIDDPPPEMHVHVLCSDYDSPGASWTCSPSSCSLSIVSRAIGFAIPEIEVRMPRRCWQAARGVAAPDDCAGAIAAEADRLLDEMARVLVIACRRGGCTARWRALRERIAALAAGDLAHQATTLEPPQAYRVDPAQPFPRYGRHRFTAGTADVDLECGLDHETDGRPLECHLVIPIRTGPIRFVRDTTHHQLAVHAPGIAGSIWLRPDEVTLTGDAVALRATR